jgi:hypothetical protein
MKRFIKSVFLFVLLFILLYPFMVLLWGLTGSRLLYSNLSYGIHINGHMYTRLEEVKNVENIDVLIIGSSHAFREIDTRIFQRHGIRAFNLGSSSQTPLQTKVLMERYLDRLQPRLIIYDVYPYFFTTDGVEPALNIIGCDRNDACSVEMARAIHNLKVYHTLFYGFFRDRFHLNANYREPAVIGDDTYISGGFVERKMGHYHPEPLPKKEFDYREELFAVFDEILSMFNERNMEYVLIDAPTTRTLYNSYTNRQPFEEIMKSRGSYYDFNQLLNLNDSVHFFDADHLNQDGVEIYDDKLIEIIKEHSLLEK